MGTNNFNIHIYEFKIKPDFFFVRTWNYSGVWKWHWFLKWKSGYRLRWLLTLFHKTVFDKQQHQNIHTNPFFPLPQSLLSNIKLSTLLIITGRLQVYLRVKTLHFHMQELLRNYIKSTLGFKGITYSWWRRWSFSLKQLHQL